jgi:hypothetical protein
MLLIGVLCRKTLTNESGLYKKSAPWSAGVLRLSQNFE